uniref:Uncharacterized protein n=1 Tax=uncultured bacterium contig00036 TaxID=1181524 RepID=A0A806KEP0_9BACT|nr:hypothetical protein [uncultured bacterium contig00036]
MLRVPASLQAPAALMVHASLLVAQVHACKSFLIAGRPIPQTAAPLPFPG